MPLPAVTAWAYRSIVVTARMTSTPSFCSSTWCCQVCRRLAVRTNASLPRLSHGVAPLEKHGWVTRAPWPQDGRHTIATLTSSGVRKVEASAPRHVQSVRTLVVDALTREQLDQLGSITAQVLGRLDAARGGRGPGPLTVAQPAAPARPFQNQEVG